MTANLALATVALLPFAVIFWPGVSGDAAIYFTFIKNFFALPFSFQPGVVSFGATSPLLVIAYAPLYQIFGAGHWLAVAKGINLSLIILGAVILNLAVKGNRATLLVICALVATSPVLFVTAAELYETGFAFLLVSALYYAMRRERIGWTSALAGLLYLARPELILIAVVIIVWLRRRGAGWPWGVLCILPVATYHAYMLVATGQVLPSSVIARKLTASEMGHTWAQSLVSTLATVWNRDGLIYLVGACCLAYLVVIGRVREFRLELSLLLPVGLLYFAFPPHGYYTRYMLPVVLVIIAIVARLIEDTHFNLVAGAASALVLIGLIGYYTPYTPCCDYDTILLHDLAQELNPILAEGDQVLLYEIQGQYYIEAECLSLDGIVGDQLAGVLRGDQTYEEFIKEHPRVRFIVTMDAFNYRRLYADTLLSRLYAHDLNSQIGDTLESDGIVLRKMLINTGNRLAWNSVYKIMR